MGKEYGWEEEGNKRRREKMREGERRARGKEEEDESPVENDGRGESEEQGAIVPRV